MRAFARQDLATCVSICNVLMTTLTPHETNMSINYTHYKGSAINGIMKLSGAVLQVIPLNVTVTLTRWVKTVLKCQRPVWRRAMSIVPSCNPSPKFMKTRKLKSQQKSRARTGTPHFVTFLKNFGACPRSASPYTVREEMYMSVFAVETIKTSIKALMT